MPQSFAESSQQDAYSLQHINVDAGLPQNSVRAIQVDHDGFLWVGTEKGLSRYDGSRFVDFSELVADIPEDVTLGIQVDSQNRVWSNWYRHNPRILSADRTRVIVIEPARGFPEDLKRKSSPKFIEQENGVIWFPGFSNIYRIDTDDSVTSIAVDTTVLNAVTSFGDQLVFGTADGLLLLNAANGKTKTVSVAQLLGTSASHRGVTWNVLRHQGALVFCHPRGVFSFDFKTDRLNLVHGPTDYSISNCEQLGSRLLVSQRKTASTESMLVTLDLNTGTRVANSKGLPEYTSTRDALGLYDVLTDDRGNHWVLMGNHLYRSRGPNGEFDEVELPFKPFGREDVFAMSLSGVVWLRTDDNGLARFSRHAKRFITIKPPADLSPSSGVRNIAVDRDNNVWLSSAGSKLLYWNRSDDTWVDKLPGNAVTIKSITSLPDGTVWVTLPGNNQLIGFDPETRTRKYEYQFRLLFSAFSQTSDGRLLFSSERHVFILAPGTGQLEQVTQRSLRGQIRALLQDSAGNIWVGTHENGLKIIEPSGHIRQWTTENSGLSSNEIFSLYMDDAGLLWIGTWHGGLLAYDPATDTFKRYGKDEGLPDSTVFGILADETGYLWLSSYEGLTRFKPCRGTNGCQPEIQVFDRRDGLQGNAFDADSHVKSDSGELFFAGKGGVNAFFPQDIPVNQTPPRVVVSRAQLNGEPLPGAKSDFIFPDRIRLPYDFGELHLELSVLDLNNPDKNRLQYRDVDTDGSWLDLSEPVLSIRGLQDGSHTFQFRGSNNDGIWSTRNAGIRFNVAPPLYRHPFVLTLYLLLLMLIPFLYYKRSQRRLLETQHLLQEQVRNRTRELELANTAREKFFANVSHEICSPVHMILLMLENHMSSASGEDKAVYSSATGYAAQLMVYLKQLVSEARSYETDSHLYAADISKIINDLVQTNQLIAQTRSVALDIAPLPAQKVAFYPSSATSIFSNLLCNALVYTPERGNIKIAGEVRDDLYQITIRNTISDIQASDIEHIFERGNRGSFNSSYFGGHGLGLSIVTSAVEALGGSIDVSLAAERRIMFTVKLPLATDAMQEMPYETDLTFSKEQVMAIKLIGEQEYQPQATAGTANGISVLIIEDDTLVASLLSQSLSRKYNVYVSGTCKEGIQLARRHHPDVILCDLFLPDQTGFEVLKSIRGNRMTSDTFFVMVTASISEADRLQGQELGVDRFVRKPISARTLELLISNYLELSAQRARHAQKESLTRRAKLDLVKNAGMSFTEKFAEVLEELYQDPSTSVEDFQTRLSLSYAALMRNCKQNFGKSPKRLLIEKRIEVASELLLSSDYRIGLIADLAGFSSHSQFAITFKRETGISPAKFRKNEK